MNGQDDSDPQSLLALNRLSGLHPSLYEVIELAIELARSFFEGEERAYDSCTFSHLVRYHIWNLLNSGAYSHIGYYIAKLANTGLELRYAGCIIKIWKADEGELPSAGDSEGRQEFMTQIQPPLFPEMFQQPLAASAKLVVIWDVSVSLGLTSLDLVCPSGFESEWKPGEAHWKVAIPHPATQIQADNAFGADDDDGDILPLDETGGDDGDDN